MENVFYRQFYFHIYGRETTSYVRIGVRVMVFNATFNNISAILRLSSFIGGGNPSNQRKPLTCRKSLTNFITYDNVVSSTPHHEWDSNDLIV